MALNCWACWVHLLKSVQTALSPHTGDAHVLHQAITGAAGVNDMRDEFTLLLKRSIDEFDADLGRMIVLASFSQNKTYLHQTLALASHLQNIRGIAGKSFTASEQHIVESTNIVLAHQYKSHEGFTN